MVTKGKSNVKLIYRKEGEQISGGDTPPQMAMSKNNWFSNPLKTRSPSMSHLNSRRRLTPLRNSED